MINIQNDEFLQNNNEVLKQNSEVVDVMTPFSFV